MNKILKDEECSRAVTHIPEQDFQPIRKYVWVTFKNNQTTPLALEKLKKSNPAQDVVRKMLGISEKKIDPFENQ